MTPVCISDADVDDIEASVEARAGDRIQVMGVGDASSGIVAVGFEVVRADGTLVEEIDVPDEVARRLRRGAIEASGDLVAARAVWVTGSRPVAFDRVSEDDPFVRVIRPMLAECSGETGPAPRAATIH